MGKRHELDDVYTCVRALLSELRWLPMNDSRGVSVLNIPVCLFIGFSQSPYTLPPHKSAPRKRILLLLGPMGGRALLLGRLRCPTRHHQAGMVRPKTAYGTAATSTNSPADSHLSSCGGRREISHGSCLQ